MSSVIETVLAAHTPSQNQSTLSMNQHKMKFKSLFKAMRKISAEQIRNVKNPPPRVRQDYEPIKLGQRIVFRRLGRLQVKRLIALHRLIKNEQKTANKLLAANMRGRPTRPRNTMIFLAIRGIFEE